MPSTPCRRSQPVTPGHSAPPPGGALRRTSRVSGRPTTAAATAVAGRRAAADLPERKNDLPRHPPRASRIEAPRIDHPTPRELPSSLLTSPLGPVRQPGVNTGAAGTGDRPLLPGHAVRRSDFVHDLCSGHGFPRFVAVTSRCARVSLGGARRPLVSGGCIELRCVGNVRRSCRCTCEHRVGGYRSPHARTQRLYVRAVVEGGRGRFPTVVSRRAWRYQDKPRD